MYIDSNGNKWYKGNIHTHTTRSDGSKTPEECIALYKENGYDFLAITDHWKMSETKYENGLLLISGCEYDIGSNPVSGVFHVTALGCTSEPELKRGIDGAERMVEEIHRHGGIANLAHPAWSMNTCEQLLSVIGGEIKPLFGADVTEIFNSVSDLPMNCRPYSGIVLDQLAARGYLTKLVADDDTHIYGTEACRSYIMVKAEECSREAILDAIKRGDFYATQGPSVEISFEDGEVRVKCSPVESVTYFTDTVWCDNRNDIGHGITSSSFKVGRETFVRAEVCDKEGRRAWSPYVSVAKAVK